MKAHILNFWIFFFFVFYSLLMNLLSTFNILLYILEGELLQILLQFHNIAVEILQLCYCVN